MAGDAFLLLVEQEVLLVTAGIEEGVAHLIGQQLGLDGPVGFALIAAAHLVTDQINRREYRETDNGDQRDELNLKTDT